MGGGGPGLCENARQGRNRRMRDCGITVPAAPQGIAARRRTVRTRTRRPRPRAGVRSESRSLAAGRRGTLRKTNRRRDRIDDIDLRRGQDRGLVTSHYDAVGVAGGQNRHVQIEHAGERLHHALSRGDVVPGRVKSEQVGHDGQLLVVDFEDGGALEESGDDFLVDESGADVDVEQADGVGARGVDHPVDGVAGAHASRAAMVP